MICASWLQRAAPRTATRALVLSVTLSATFGATARAQDQLSPATRATLDRLIDSARVAGLPASLLLDKVAEGKLKGADDERLVRAVRILARELGDARAALGSSVDVAVLGAAASALHVGVPVDDLRRMARAGGSPAPTTLASALVTLVDLVAKRIPVGLATRSVEDLLDRRGTERHFAALRADVSQDIVAGRSPEQALITRTTAQLRALDPAAANMPRRPPAAP